MNETIEKLLQHRSVRSFEDKCLTNEQIQLIVQSAQAASTSSFIQAYSIIGVQDQNIKKQLSVLAGNQSYVEKNGHFFVFCADLYRHILVGEMEKKDVSKSLESTEKFMVSLIDASLAAQNAAIAAESMGLGICFIGGIRNQLEKVSELLNVPEYVIPLFGLAVGYPKKLSDQKPRLPLHHIYHENTYIADKVQSKSELEEYNKVIRAYYLDRTSGERDETWTEQVAGMLQTKSRMYMKEYIEKQRMNRR